MKIQCGVAIFILGTLTITSCASHDEKLQGSEIEAQKVVRVIDGDTIELENDQVVRLIGIDTPEKGCRGYKEAKKNMQDLVLAKRIVLVSDGKQTTDRYGRLLRYVDLGGKDIGYEQIKDGYADADYDSLTISENGNHNYPKHSRQDKYRKADKKDFVC